MIKVNVTQKHIDDGQDIVVNGFNLRSQSCPIARALVDAGFNNPSVCYLNAFVEDKESTKRMEIKFSKNVGNFINTADEHKPIEPFSFLIDTKGYI